MAGTTIKGVGNDGNVQIRDMVTAAKQNAGTGFQAVWNKTQNNAQTTGNDGRTTDGRNDVRRARFKAYLKGCLLEYGKCHSL